MIIYVRCNDCGETIDKVWAETCPHCGGGNLQGIHEREFEDENAPEPPDDDDPHGITAQNKWADEEYGLNDGTG